jgi:hypothetical protein
MTSILAQLPLAASILALPRCQFAGFDYQSVETGEVARHSVILGGSTEEMYKKDIAILENVAKHRGILAPIFGEAVDAILASRRESLAKGIGNNDAYTNADTYEIIGNGLKIHKADGTLYVTGLSNGKTILTPATTPRKYPNSKPLTKAKREVETRFELPSRKFRTFALRGMKGARVNGSTLVIY